MSSAKKYRTKISLCSHIRNFGSVLFHRAQARERTGAQRRWAPLRTPLLSPKRSRRRAPSKASPQTAVQPNSEPAPITTHQYHQDWEEQVMRVSICIGSACHLRGSREIIQKLQTLVKANNISDKVDLNGAFCSGNCVNGVCVTIDGELFSLSPETTEEFFNKEIMGRL